MAAASRVSLWIVPPTSVVAAASLAPSLVIARSGIIVPVGLAVALVLASVVTRQAFARWAPTHVRGYVVSRLFSARYQLPALAVPLISAAAIARLGALGAMLAFGGHIALAFRYRRRLTQPGALTRALPVALFGGFFVALERLALSGDEWGHGGRLLHAEESPLQRVVLVERNGSVDLFIDGELQFRSADERLYHEALVAPSLSLLPEGARVLVMGGGDGLAARELLQSPRVASVTIVDWDRAVTQLFRRERELSALNQGSLDDPRVVTLHRDVRALFCEPGEPFDLVVGDLVDPSAPGSEQAGLYSSAFYRTVQTRIAPGGVLVTHASSDEDKFLRGVCDALAAASFSDVETYCREIPSFGSVCYVLARR